MALLLRLYRWKMKVLRLEVFKQVVAAADVVVVVVELVVIVVVGHHPVVEPVQEVVFVEHLARTLVRYSLPCASSRRCAEVLWELSKRLHWTQQQTGHLVSFDAIH